MKQNIAILLLLSGASAMKLRSLQEEAVEDTTEAILEEPVDLEGLGDDGQQARRSCRRFGNKVETKTTS